MFIYSCIISASLFCHLEVPQQLVLGAAAGPDSVLGNGRKMGSQKSLPALGCSQRNVTITLIRHKELKDGTSAFKHVLSLPFPKGLYGYVSRFKDSVVIVSGGQQGGQPCIQCIRYSKGQPCIQCIRSRRLPSCPGSGNTEQRPCAVQEVGRRLSTLNIAVCMSTPHSLAAPPCPSPMVTVSLSSNSVNLRVCIRDILGD